MVNVDIAIIGGGIAGLSTAVACSQVGQTAHIYEAAPAFTPVGTSLSLWPNALACLDDWGLADIVTKDGAPIKNVAWRRPDGRAFFKTPLGPLHDNLGYESICVRRADLHRHLANVIAPKQLHTGKQLQSWEDHQTHVALRFADGTRVTAKHVVAADGIWSQMRREILNDGDPTYAGYGAWLGLSSAHAPLAGCFEGTEYIGPNGRMGVFETGQDTRYWFFIARIPDLHRRVSVTDTADVNALIQDWPEAFHEILAQTPRKSVIKAGFYDRPVSGKWGAGNVTLIGDAIHPFLPNLGQGACQSIEDAHVLAAAFAAGKSGASVTRWMEQKRVKRVRSMQRISRQVGTLGQTENTATRFVRSAMGVWPMTTLTQRQFRDQFTR